jgi:hypothetical protein
MGDRNGDEDGGGVYGDDSGDNYPSRQGARTETSVPRTSSSMVAALQNFLWTETRLFRVFASERIYRQKGDVRHWTRGPHHLVAWPGGTRATPWCCQPLALLRLCFRLCLRVGKIGGLAFVSSNSENMSCVTFLKHKNC